MSPQIATGLEYEVVQATDCPDEWIVEAIDYDDEGKVLMTRFSGKLAHERAEEYAQWIHSAA